LRRSRWQAVGRAATLLIGYYKQDGTKSAFRQVLTEEPRLESSMVTARPHLRPLGDSDKLSELARHTILTLENEVLVSSVSEWEIAIKRALGKLEAPHALGAGIDDAGFVRRLARFEDCENLEALPPHHHDPFDPMLVALALVDGIPVVTRDTWIARYGAQTIW